MEPVGRTVDLGSFGQEPVGRTVNLGSSGQQAALLHLRLLLPYSSRHPFLVDFFEDFSEMFVLLRQQRLQRLPTGLRESLSAHAASNSLPPTSVIHSGG